MQDRSNQSASTQTSPGRSVRLEWSHGAADVFPLGAAIHNLTFVLAGGQLVRPLAEAPWHGEPGIVTDETIPAHLRHLGGEWPCVPFGRSSADPVGHGFGTDNLWTCETLDGDRQTWSIDYPDDRPVARVRRTIKPVADAPAVDFSLEVTARRNCTLPIGLHPIVRLPEAGERFAVEAAFARGEIFPVTFEAGVSRLRPCAQFHALDELPLVDGSAISLPGLCRERTEEAFQLMGAEGVVALAYPDAGYRLRISWDPSAFSTCLFWLSAQGRTAKPWGGRFRGLGVEPLEARFVERDGQGAIADGVALLPGQIWATSYRIAVEELS